MGDNIWKINLVNNQLSNLVFTGESILCKATRSVPSMWISLGTFHLHKGLQRSVTGPVAGNGKCYFCNRKCTQCELRWSICHSLPLIETVNYPRMPGNWERLHIIYTYENQNLLDASFILAKNYSIPNEPFHFDFQLLYFVHFNSIEFNSLFS